MASLDTADLAREYAALTEGCGLVDRSERGKLALTGADAVEFLNGQVTNELLDLRPGEGRYAAFLTHKGKMLGDLRILAAGDTATPARDAASALTGDGAGDVSELLLDTERVALQALFDTIRRFKVGYRVELHKRTLESALLSLIGPDADEIAGRAFALDTTHAPNNAETTAGAGEGLPEHEHDHLLGGLDGTKPGAVPIRLIRTDAGIDVLCDASAVGVVRAALQSAGATAVTEAGAEIVRVEQGQPRYGIDIDESTIPQEAGLNERAVSFTKGCYVGQETVARLHYKGKPNRHLRGLRLSEPTASGTELRLVERAVGVLTSTVLSPTFGPIGLALLRREAEPGAILTAGEEGATATVVELPFQ